ncbi:MAG: GNAT family acetyltransferase [Desulfofustis sp.]|nr:GNAT family acetyltransferase [Desulfofustis sp.]
MEIRSVQSGDDQQVIALWRRCGLVVAWNDPQRDIERKRAVQPELFLAGELSGRLVGSVMAGYDGHRGWLYYLAVDPDFRRRGLGRLLVEEAQRRLVAMGCPKINLLVRTSNEVVLDFYRRLGFKPDDVQSLGKRLIAD